jgi:hypothetical protein
MRDLDGGLTEGDRAMNARTLTLLTVSLLLLGCSGYDVVKLRHPVTGGVVQCGPFVEAQQEAECLRYWQAQGFERIPR